MEKSFAELVPGSLFGDPQYPVPAVGFHGGAPAVEEKYLLFFANVVNPEYSRFSCDTMYGAIKLL